MTTNLRWEVQAQRVVSQGPQSLKRVRKEAWCAPALA